MKSDRCLPLIAVLVISALVSGCSRGQNQNAAPALRAVHVAQPQRQPLDQMLHGMGLLAPKDEARLSFKVAGVLESIGVEEGQRVHAGQVLAALKQAEIGASVEQARQTAEKARRDLERGRALLADGVATEESVQDLTTAYQLSVASRSSVEFNAAHARIVAPADGVVLRKLAEAHEVIPAGQTVLVIGGATRGWVVRMGLADRDVVRLKLGDAARVEFDAWPSRSFAGRVSNIASAAEAATGTFTVEVQVEPASSPFVQGLVAKVSVDLPSTAEALLIPVQALLEANDREAGVFVLDPASQVVRRVTIEIGEMRGGHIQVLKGLPADAHVVIEGAAFLANGETVRVVS